ncbi:MAG TPA: LexA family transcriptional regulator [Verrucomicrobiae bacterium]|nr:LexA family transcriptional regulator [Verrucomicrobiae bacterium]
MQQENAKKRELFSVRLKGLRARLGLTQSELAAKLGVSPGSVGNWESEENVPKGAVLRKVADFFGVSPQYFSDEKFQPPPPAREEKAIANLALLEGEAHYKLSPVVAPTTVMDPEVFILEMFGDEMEPRISPGDELTVSPNARLDGGDLVVAKKTTEEIIIRKYYALDNKRCQFVAYNPAYPPVEARRDEFKFIYPVVAMYRKLKVRGLYDPAAADGKYPKKQE